MADNEEELKKIYKFLRNINKMFLKSKIQLGK